jgi:poly(A) polymerase
LDAEGLAACAELAEGLDTLSRERVGAEMRKLLAAPDPAPSVASMETAGILWRILPGATSASLAVLVHLEPTADLSPDPIRRLAAIGGVGIPDRLRLSRKDTARLVRLTEAVSSPMAAGELGYRLGPEAVDVLALRAAALGQPLDPNQIALARHGVTQTLPVSASDLMPALTGPALGDRLRQIEARWIASGFTLGKDALLS